MQDGQTIAVEAGRVMFEWLRHGGYDRGVVGYDARAGGLDLNRVAPFKGSVEVENKPLLGALRGMLRYYLGAALPDGYDHEAGSYGLARPYPASGYATFQHVERAEEFVPFARGVPGPDVPEGERFE